MHRKLAVTAVAFALALGLSLAGATGARAIPLSTLVGGGPVVVGDLVFSDFEVVITGDLISNLSFYNVNFGGDGFVLVGPLSAADGEVGLMDLSFNVSTVDPSKSIVSAELFANNLAFGVGAQAAVDELLSDASSNTLLAALSTFDTGATAGDAIFQDDTALPGVQSLDVFKSIFLDSMLVGGALGGSARIGMIRQSFAVVPEPSTLALLTLGLLGLVAAGSPRRQAIPAQRRVR